MILFIIAFLFSLLQTSFGVHCVWDVYDRFPCCSSVINTLCGCDCQQVIYGRYPFVNSCASVQACGCYSCDYVPGYTFCCPSGTSGYCYGYANGGYSVMCCPASAIYTCKAPNGNYYCSPTFCLPSSNPPCPTNCVTCDSDNTCGAGGCSLGYTGTSCSSNVVDCDACKSSVSQILGSAAGVDCADVIIRVLSRARFGGTFGILAGALVAIIAGDQCDSAVSGLICSSRVFNQCPSPLSKREEPTFFNQTIYGNSYERREIEKRGTAPSQPTWPSSFFTYINMTDSLNISTVSSLQSIGSYMKAYSEFPSLNLYAYTDCVLGGGSEYIWSNGSCSYARGKATCNVPSNYMNYFAILIVGNATDAFQFMGSTVNAQNQTIYQWEIGNGTRILKYWDFASNRFPRNMEFWANGTLLATYSFYGFTMVNNATNITLPSFFNLSQCIHNLPSNRSTTGFSSGNQVTTSRITSGQSITTSLASSSSFSTSSSSSTGQTQTGTSSSSTGSNEESLSWKHAPTILLSIFFVICMM